MTFRLTCPVCGKRDVYEFTYGGPERGPRPAETDLEGGAEAHFRWSQFRMNRPEAREEWWYHGAGCGVWFSTWRNPATNREERPDRGSDGGAGPDGAGTHEGDAA